jgi:TetR/AcrR family transcriptional regulator, tetracycline repressor protein
LPDPADWQDYLFQMGQRFRAALMSRRDGARVHAGTRANRTELEQHMQVLVEAGLPLPVAVQLLVSLGCFVVGYVLEQQAATTTPAMPLSPETLAGQAVLALREMGDDAAFAAGLRMLIAGAAGRV